LDLVLAAFAEMPDYYLTVCGPLYPACGPPEKNFREKDFEKAFYKELYETSNIRTIGWVDIASLYFLKITNQCLGLVYPSCAEGQSGAVITCLHAGLIPIISYESGVDVHNFGLILKDCSIEEIQKTIRTVSNFPAHELKAMAIKAWQYARAHHTRERFTEEYRKVIETILATHRKQSVSLEHTDS
jgi:glycosyltransferase involved in cell wall biosynthesis